MYKIVCFEFFNDNSFNIGFSNNNELHQFGLIKTLNFINNKHKKVGIKTLKMLFSKLQCNNVFNINFCDGNYFLYVIKRFEYRMEVYSTVRNVVIYKFDEKGKLIKLVNLKRK